jgi:cytochrome oxidase Cu insertion factor (SCO1/SenC/PrrC family)
MEDRVMSGPAPPRPHAREEAHALVGIIALFTITAAWWALALWPVAAAPEWLERTRYVCFGVAANGLPDTGGWIGLVGGPLGMLAIFIAGWSTGLAGLVRRARTSRPLAFTLSLLTIGCIVLVTGAAVRVKQAGTGSGIRSDAEAIAGSPGYRAIDRPAPALTLTGQHGEPVDLGALRGRPVLITFAFAHCQTVCPVVVMHSLAAQRALQGTAHEPAVLVITLDPWRDTPSRLAAMAKAWSLPPTVAWVLSGPVETVETTLDAWVVPRSRDMKTGDIVHPALIYVIDARGRIAYESTGGTDTLIELIRAL